MASSLRGSTEPYWERVLELKPPRAVTRDRTGARRLMPEDPAQLADGLGRDLTLIGGWCSNHSMTGTHEMTYWMPRCVPAAPCRVIRRFIW
jgi:hypothetical protein